MGKIMFITQVIETQVHRLFTSICFSDLGY